MNADIAEDLKKSVGLTIALGVLLIILGLVTIALPFLGTIAIAIILAWVFIIGGVIRLIYAIQSRKTGGFGLKILVSILYIILGILLLTNLLEGIVTLTLLLGIFIFVEGVFEVVVAFQLRPRDGWGWTLFSGIVTVILGILIGSQWPFNAAWLLGLLVGISLLVSGIWTVMYAVALRRSLNPV